jgi:hypothetical protein
VPSDSIPENIADGVDVLIAEHLYEARDTFALDLF